MGNTCCTAEGRQQIVEEAEEAIAKVAEVAEDMQEKVAETLEEVKDTVAEAVSDVKEGAAAVVEAAADTMTAAAAAVTGTMIVEFESGKGSTKTSISFTSQELGFAPARSGGGCCASAAQVKVVVGKVDKSKQADKLGVKRGWVIKSVNGTEVTGLEEVRKLLADGRATLAAEPEA